MASIGWVQIIKLSTWNLFRLVQIETIQRRSPAVRDPRGAKGAAGLSARPLGGQRHRLFREVGDNRVHRVEFGGR